MASYRKRENGKWEYRISYKSHDGKYKKAEKGGFSTKKLRKLQLLKERKNYFFPLMFRTTLPFTTTSPSGLPFIRNLIFLP